MNDHTASTEHLLFAGGYARPEQPGILAFHFDSANGTLSRCGAVAGIVNPTFLVVHPNRRWLYAVSETSQSEQTSSGAVWSLSFDHATGAIETMNQQPSRGDSPCHLQIDPTGEWLLVSNYSSGSVGVLPIGGSGELGAMTDLIEHRDSTNAQRQAHAHSATFTPDQQFVLVADLGLDELVMYRFDAAAGKLSRHGHTSTRQGAGPRHVAFHPNGRQLYVANELDSTLGVYDYDPGGALHERQVISTLPAGQPSGAVADIHISESGEHVYVSNRGHDSVAVFAIGPDGQVERVAEPACGGKWPRNFALAPGGRYLLVANQHSDEVAVLPVLEDPQALGAPVARAAVLGASCIQFVPAHD